MAGRRKRPSLPTEWSIISPAPDGTIKKREPLRAPTIPELVELRVAILCKHASELGSLLGEENFRTLIRLIAWQYHQLSPPQPLDQEFVDFVRWRAVRVGVEEKGWDGAADYAVNQLRNSPFAAGAAMMIKSHEKIQKRLRGLQPRRGDAFKFTRN
jgi:hypothetical protein